MFERFVFVVSIDLSQTMFAGAIVVMDATGEGMDLFQLRASVGITALRSNSSGAVGSMSQRIHAMHSGFHLELGDKITCDDGVVICGADSRGNQPAGWITPSYSPTHSEEIDVLGDGLCCVLPNGQCWAARLHVTIFKLPTRITGASHPVRS